MGKTFEKKLPYKKAICYSGYREGQCPTGEMPSKEQISEDLHLLVQSIRTSRSVLQSLAGQRIRHMMTMPIMRRLQIRSATWKKLPII